MTNVPPPPDLSVRSVGRWAQNHQHLSDDRLSAVAGVAAKRITECRRIVKDLSPMLVWTVDAQLITPAKAVQLCRLKSHNEQVTLAAAIIHTGHTRGSQPSRERVQQIVSAHLRDTRPGLPEIMSRFGLHFGTSETEGENPAELGELYEAAWQWGDRTLEQYRANAPRRLAALTTAMRKAEFSARIKLSTDEEVGIDIKANMRPEPD